jgi:hypothetical protein
MHSQQQASGEDKIPKKNGRNKPMCSLLQASPPPLPSKYSQIHKISPSHNLMKHYLSPFLQKEGIKNIVRK